MNDRWVDGDDYEPFMGRWSTVIARAFVAELAAPHGGRWLDVGCGTGALTAQLLALDPVGVVGVDPSEGFLTSARRRLDHDHRFSFFQGSGSTLGFADEQFEGAVSGLVLNFVPDPVRMLREMLRVTAHDGLVGLYVWDYAGEMGMLRRFWDTAVELDPAAASLDEGVRFPVCNPEAMRRVAVEAGMARPRLVALEALARFDDFDDYWEPFLGGQGPAPTYLAELPETKRELLRTRLRERLTAEPEGPFQLPMRAWALIGSPGGP